ncbi:MAG: peptide transporter [Nitrospiraceae bacterium]|nr:peptide transporter [Nitrospiraceae bacterium]
MSDDLHQDLEFQDGFSVRTMIGAVFVGLVMMPGTIYLSLVAGAGLGPAAQWVTIILFTEMARRSFTTLRKQEVYILYYMAAALAMTGGPFGLMIFNQYLVQSPQAIGFGIADQIPEWIVPARTSPAITGRNLFSEAWYVPILLTTFLWIIGRATALTTGYMLFRITSDIEKLSFPLAPIAAEGATALAETTAKKETWRWNVFSVGAAIGLAFGAIYVGIPGFTGVLFSKPLQIIPIPFVDLTKSAHHLLPAALAGVSLDLGALIFGMVLPFAMVAGTFTAAVATAFIATPLLYKFGMLPHWRPGMSLIPTKIAIDFDFWMSIGIGASLCVALLGLYKVITALIFTNRDGRDKGMLTPPKGRGDMKLRWCIVVYLAASTCSILLCKFLLKDDAFPTMMVLAYALVITPAISYVSARMIGLTGAPIAFPFLREGSIILSGYRGVDIWYAPLPLADYGPMTQMFRELTLTRTKFSSLVKVELFMLPICLICSLVFWAFFWHIESIPSATYPFTAKMWPLQATYQCLFMSATTGESTWLVDSIRPSLIACGAGLGFLLLALTSVLGAPTLFFYGMIGGIGAIPNAAIPMFVGAIIGRKVFEPRYGKETWRRYTPVLAAGYACGVGLIGMLAVAFAMVAKSVSSLPF